MSRKRRVSLLLLLCSVFLLCVVVFLFQPKTSYEHRQVKKIAQSEDNYILDFSTHISNVVRPDEHFIFPITLGETGPVKPLYSGPLQYPFYCMTLDSGLGQPLVDNHLGFGVPVYEADSNGTFTKLIGYSKDCSIPSQLRYFRITDVDFIEELTDKMLQDPEYLMANTKQLLRVEQGSINRFIYTVVMPISFSEVGDRIAKSQWNERLIYQFQGGSGIGYRQGRQRPSRVIKRQLQQLLDGYAVISSSGNKTSYTYNMLLAEDTARRVKQQFVSLYGLPVYTVGIGGSGGGLAQYLIAQNSQGILDGIIPLYSYPDMITQTTYALDCDLLNNYFTFRASRKKDWQDWQRRQSIEGLNAINGFKHKADFLQPLNQVFAGVFPLIPEGSNECINGYFGLSSFINNPKQGFIRNFFHPDIINDVRWSYWQDLESVLGTDEQGFALSTWDNVGVQYGLRSLRNGEISLKEFLDVNRKIGSWKSPTKMQQETLYTPFGYKMPLWLSLWGKQNITRVKNNVAKRHEGSISAMNAAYLSGQVFIGKVALPVLDVRHYLEDELDMHHVSASFSSRLRMIEANGHANNHLIWIAHKEHTPLKEAFAVMEEWLLSIKQKNISTLSAKPLGLSDRCYDKEGNIIDEGDNTWNGQWNNKAPGKCFITYPMFSTSRIEADASWAGDLFKCQLIPIEQAIERGFYGPHDMQSQIGLLKQVFPQGVCDFTKGDVGRPNRL